MKGIVKVMSGICGMITEIRATSDEQSGTVKLEFNTRCENIQQLADELDTVHPFEEIAFRGEGRGEVFLEGHQVDPPGILEIVCGLEIAEARNERPARNKIEVFTVGVEYWVPVVEGGGGDAMYPALFHGVNEDG